MDKPFTFAHQLRNAVKRETFRLVAVDGVTTIEQRRRQGGHHVWVTMLNDQPDTQEALSAGLLTQEACSVLEAW